MSPALRRIAASWRWLHSRLSRRGDTEHEQALIRIGIVGLLLVYASLVPMDRPALPPWVPSVAQVGYLVITISCLHFAWIVLDPAVRYRRRAVWMVIDHAAIVLAMAVGGEPMALLYPLLLWVTLGHGFRYGPRHLLGSAVISVLLFGPLVLQHPFWQTKGAFGVGLIMGLVLIPAYCYRLLHHLHDARRRAEASSEAKSRFLATMSHELRTPLHAILGMTDLLRGTALQADQRDMTRTIHTAGHGLLNMIEDLLDIARIEAGAHREERERFDVHALLHEVRDMLGYRARTKGLQLRLRFDPDLPGEVIGPKRGLRQILINLVANAVKFTDRGEVRIEAGLQARPGGTPHLAITVADTGCGIPRSAQERIFESFTQVDETTTRRHGGSGLGLAIVKRLIDTAGGTIAVDSELEQGTRFEVHLPVTPGTDRDPPEGAFVVLHGSPTAEQRQGLAAAGLAVRPAVTVDPAFLWAQAADLWCPNGDDLDPPARVGRDLIVWGAGSPPSEAIVVLPAQPTTVQLRRALRAAVVIAEETPDADDAGRVQVGETSLEVLVADDHRINREVIDRLVSRNGHRAVTVDSGEAALAALERTAFDVVILDLNMPGMGGIACAREIARQAQRPRLVAVTADATTATQASCLAAGFDTCLTKPVDSSRLLAAIESGARAAPEPAPVAASPGAATVIDHRRLEMLRELDGDAFLKDIIDGFIADGRELVDDIVAAAVAGDTAGFRDAAHALRSSATHLGATALFDRCLTLKAIDEETLRAQARALSAELEAAFTTAAAALRAARDASPEPAPRRDISSPAASFAPEPAVPSCADPGEPTRARARPRGR